MADGKGCGRCNRIPQPGSYSVATYWVAPDDAVLCESCFMLLYRCPRCQKGWYEATADPKVLACCECGKRRELK